MGTETKIEWANSTWNPWVGCSKEHTGCLNCYAEASMATWLKKVKWGPGGTRWLTSEDKWQEVHKLADKVSATGQSHTVFTASLADLFEAWPGQMQDDQKRPLYLAGGMLPSGRPRTFFVEGEGEAAGHVGGSRACKMDDVLRSVLKVANELRSLHFLMLTKRPYLIRDRIAEAAGLSHLPYNCIVGTSISDQPTAEFYAGALRDMKEQGIIRTAFLSYEPATGPVDWKSLRLAEWCDWLIAGGESADRPGVKPRPCKEAWLDAAQNAAADAHVPFFRKQAGAIPIDTRGRRVIYRDDKGGDDAEWPLKQRCRQLLVNPDGTLLRL